MNIGSTVASPVQRKFAEHALWRRESLQKLRQLDEWLVLQGLVDASVKERLNHLENRLRSDKILVAFVAEFSRGKSELINALFFADYGCRIMPASAGRTTMCPVELGFDANLSPGLRLLPIDTRLLPQGLAEWRARPSAWTEVALEVGKVFDTEKSIISSENLGIARLIYQLPTTLCEMFLQEVFKKNPIDALDQETLFTIYKFFENNLNVSETARKLFVHRNTLVYRLEKIKKLTGLDLREFDDAITFKVALMVKKYLTSRGIDA